jgi:hypothetical protein
LNLFYISNNDFLFIFKVDAVFLPLNFDSLKSFLSSFFFLYTISFK